jgi:hypothetical protein
MLFLYISLVIIHFINCFNHSPLASTTSTVFYGSWKEDTGELEELDELDKLSDLFYDFESISYAEILKTDALVPKAALISY